MTVKVADTVLGKVARMQNDLFRRVREGTLNPDEVVRKLQEIIETTQSLPDLITDWQNFYRDIGIHCELSEVQIPDDPGGFDRVIIVAQGMTPQTAYDLCQKHFKCWKWTDENLNETVISDRTAKNGPYAIRVRYRVEADEELKNLSANQLMERGIAGITLEERLIYEYKYFKETGKHLDIVNITLCAGSRFSDGFVPGVSWFEYYGRLRVGWCNPGNSHVSLRSRAVVS